MGWLCQRCGAENAFKTSTCRCCAKKSKQIYRLQERLSQAREYTTGLVRAAADSFVPEELYLFLHKEHKFLKILTLTGATLCVGLLIIFSACKGFPSVFSQIVAQNKNWGQYFSQQTSYVPDRLEQIGKSLTAVRFDWDMASRLSQRQTALQRDATQQLKKLQTMLDQIKEQRVQRSKLVEQQIDGLEASQHLANQRWINIKDNVNAVWDSWKADAANRWIVLEKKWQSLIGLFKR